MGLNTIGMARFRCMPRSTCKRDECRADQAAPYECGLHSVSPRSAGQSAREIHIVLDNLSAHTTQAVTDFLDENPKSGSISPQPTRPG
jgi:hypothetical protein